MFPKQNEILTDLGFQGRKGFFKKTGYVRALGINQHLQLHLPHHHRVSKQFNPGHCHLQSFLKEVMLPQQLNLDETKDQWKINSESQIIYVMGGKEAIVSIALPLSLLLWLPNTHKVNNLQVLLHSLLLLPSGIQKQGRGENQKT